MKKGGGTGPAKPWQPAVSTRKGAKSDSSAMAEEKDKLQVVQYYFPNFIVCKE